MSSKQRLIPSEEPSEENGDTIRVRQAGRAITVRLACIDAPVHLDVNSTDRFGRKQIQLLPIGTAGEDEAGAAAA